MILGRRDMRFYSSAFAKIDKVNSGSAVALGCFDGVHLGHKKVIEIAVRFATLAVMAQREHIDRKATRCTSSAYLAEKRKWKQRDFMYRGRLL